MYNPSSVANSEAVKLFLYSRSEVDTRIGLWVRVNIEALELI